jgi:hypothetical protein
MHIILKEKKFLFIFLAHLFCSIESNSTNLLHEPEVLSATEITKKATEWQTSFTWKYPGISISFVYENQQAGFAVKLFEISVYLYQYRLLPTTEELKTMISAQNYYFAEPLVIMKSCPQQISMEQLTEIIKTKQVVFYTGAGISASGDVATMSTLMQSLKMDKGLLHFLKFAWKNPQELTNHFSTFCLSAIHANPTNAHEALKEISINTKRAIITENVDLLQQRTGIDPIHAASKDLHSLAEYMRKIDTIICIGLSHDDRGLLSWYKQCNPHGIIIALDLKIPSYLSSHDYVLLGDLQETLPFLSSKL